MVLIRSFSVDSPSVADSDGAIEAEYCHVTTSVSTNTSPPTVTSRNYHFKFRTQKKVPRLGVMLVGWGGNNGSTITASILANRLNMSWHTKHGKQTPNYFGSLLMSSTTRLGTNAEGDDVFVPLHSILPMVHPSDIVFSGWDIDSTNLGVAMRRASVLDHDLQLQLMPHMTKLRPLPSIYYPTFIAANQEDRANNLLPGSNKYAHLQELRRHIRQFKDVNVVDQVIVIWTATTERFSEVIPGINDTATNLLKAIKTSHSEVSPSTLFAVASILEGVPYLNGSPQNTFVPGCIDLAEREGVFIGGDDFKSGQTKFKSVLVDMLVAAGIRPRAIVSYNHLGNNDGRNLSAPLQFRSKEVSKASVVDDVVASNGILYEDGIKPDHVVVIKYVPSVGDSKRAMDEYTSDIFMNGVNTIVVHNTCEDSLLAAPLIIDLALLCELCCRISYKMDDAEHYERFHPVLSFLSYMFKAPLVPNEAPIVNALFKQRACIENLLRVCAGLPVETDLRLEHNTSVGLARGKPMANGK